MSPSMLDFAFPPKPRGMKGRAAELRLLERTIAATLPARLALVGSGGSGKSLLAAALGHRLSPRFGGRISWFRVGAWDFRTVTEMMALRFGLPWDDRRVSALRRFFTQAGPRLIVLDNHEDDEHTARVLDAFAKQPVTFVITARRCLLGGLMIFPVTAPLVTSGASAFPRVAQLTRILRWNPLALDIADSIVGSRVATARELETFLRNEGADRVRPIEHEDDLPEVALLIDWAWRRLSRPSRRLLGALAHSGGDHMDLEALRVLASLGKQAELALSDPLKFHLIQEPLPGRYTLHAVVRHAIVRRTAADPERAFEHYMSLLEENPERLSLEQSHLYAAMDHAHQTSSLPAMLRIEALLRRFEDSETE
jgi:hypothetical protein